MSDQFSAGPGAGVVVIGRNEGERLRRCLASITHHAEAIVYVDSGSSDGSVELARSLGISVVMLDLNHPFTAGRARNAGFRRLRLLAPGLRYVQFVDGDCEIARDWLARAVQLLHDNAQLAVVCGRRRERYPEHSVYNRLCDIEWDTPVGEAKACGGDFMARVDAFEAVQGFCPALIAGEEPELCVRLRASGRQIQRIAAEMTLHDAAIEHFGQWWRRTLRSGYAFAEGASLHGAPPERHWVRESRSAWLWGMAIPLLVLAIAVWWSSWGLLLLLVYPLQVLRLAVRAGLPPRESWWRAGFLVLGKFPEMLGQLKFLIHRYAGSQARLIEYK